MMVDEQKEQTQEEPKGTEVNNADGNEYASTEIIERARQERQRLEQENERFEKNLKELRDLEAARLLGGTAGAYIKTQITPEEAEKLKAQALADEITHAFK